MPLAAAALDLSTPTVTASGTSGTSGTAATWTEWNRIYVLTGAGSGGGTGTITTEATVTIGTGGGASSASIWMNWNRHYTSTTTASTTIQVEGATVHVVDPWPAWNQEYAHTVNAVAPVISIGTRISNEEYQARLRRQEAERRERQAQWEAERPAREARARAEAAEIAAAKERAALILRESLTPEQQAELAEKNYFTIRSIRPSGEERFYRIHRGRSHNVEHVDASGRKIRRYCMHPIVQCPDEDTMLTQKLWLQNPDLEDEFLRRANRS